MERLASLFSEHPVRFIVIYTREPHAKEGIFRDLEQPSDDHQRRKYAERAQKELGIHRKILIDTMEGTVQKLYGGLPNMVYIIDPEGRVVFHDRWADAKAVKQALEKIFASS